MSVEEVNQLFEPYSQANENIQKSFEGNRLGWLCKKLIELMKWEIIIDSMVGVGLIL